MGQNDVDSTGGTSSDCASGNPPVVFFSGQDQPYFLSNNQVLKNLRDAGFMDADTDEAKRSELFKAELSETIEEFERFAGSPVPIPGFPFNWRSVLSACC